MPTTCYITSDNASGIYYCGQNVSGSIELKTTTKKTIRAIHITVHGRAKVLWIQTRPYSEKAFRAEEIYLNYRTYVEGRESGSSFDLNPGTYNYNFNCILPQSLPTSFVGEYGKIEYYIMLTIDRPCKIDNVFKKNFTVIHNINLNLDPRYKLPNLQQDFTTIGGYCCQSGPLKMKLTTPITGYIPGQLLVFTCLVQNRSSSIIKQIVAGLKQEVCFTSESPHTKTKTTKHSIAKKIIGNIQRFSNKEFCDSLTIPLVPQTTLETCKIIDIRYYLYVKVKTGCFSTELTLFIPITIGTLPIYTLPLQTATVISTQPTSTGILYGGSRINFRPTGPEESDQEFSDRSSGTMSDSGDGEDLPPSYSSIKPPSYRDAMTFAKSQPKILEKNCSKPIMEICPV